MDSTERRDIMEILSQLLFGKIRRIRNTVVRIRLTLLVLDALAVLEK